MAGSFTEDRNDYFFVYGNEDEGVDGREDGNGAGGDDKVGAQFSVHKAGLADEEGGELSEGNGESYGGCPYRENPNEAFEFLYLCHCA